MTDDQARPAAGFETVETFSNLMPFASFIRRMIPLAVMLFLITWLILGLLLGLTDLPAVALIAFVLALLFVAAMVYMRKWQFDRLWGSATLEFSPEGATERVGPLRTDLAWGSIRALGKQGLTSPLVATPTSGDFGSNVVTGAAAPVGSAVANKADQDALLGGGSLTLSPDTSSITKAQYDLNVKQRQTDQETGRPMVAVLLTPYDADWHTGRIGAWIRAYRPDLLG